MGGSRTLQTIRFTARVRAQEGVDAVKDNRPVNLDIGTIALPITAYISILHRASGVFLAAGVALLIWLLDASLASEESFNGIKQLMSGIGFKLATWLVLVGLAYHVAAGVRHLIMDAGIGESMAGGVLGAKVVLVVSVIVAVLAGVWLW